MKNYVTTTREPEIGQTMKDGTKFAGISPSTGNPMYALPADAPLTMRWQQAMEYAAVFEGHGQPKGTFRVPTKDELNVLFQHKAKIGGFNESGSYPGGFYWSSTQPLVVPGIAYSQLFTDGDHGWSFKPFASSLRLVRD